MTKYWLDGIGQRGDMHKTMLSDDALANLQREVQWKLGRCMIRLQQYERLMKSIVANMAVEGPPEQLQAIRDHQVACASTMTLGTLMGMFTGNYLSPAAPEGVTEPFDDSTDQELTPQGWFRTRHLLTMSPERYEQTKQTLAKLVALRNELVHCFLERFDLWQETGCRAADTYLNDSYEQIDGHYLVLVDWAKNMERMRTLTASIMQTPQFDDAFVHGIHPDGTVHWPISTIVECLRNAEQACAADSWTLLDSAIAFIRTSYPDQVPTMYGCTSWRQVLKKSEQFVIRTDTNPQNGRGQAWYRSREEIAAN